MNRLVAAAAGDDLDGAVQSGVAVRQVFDLPASGYLSQRGAPHPLLMEQLTSGIDQSLPLRGAVRRLGSSAWSPAACSPRINLA